MIDIGKSKCGWMCWLCCLIGVVALALILMHRSDEEMHVAVSGDVSGGDEEPGSKKFDHLELLNLGPAEIVGVKVTLADKNGAALIPAIDVGPLTAKVPVYHPVLQDKLGVKKVILTYEYQVGGSTWVRTRTVQVFEPATEADYVRAATFWCRCNAGPDQIPEFWGHALIVNVADQHDNTVVPNLDPGADIELP
jgi:hypothetical protein